MVWSEWVEIIDFAVSKFAGSTNSVICGVPYFAAGSCNYIMKYWISFSSEVSTSEKNLKTLKQLADSFLWTVITAFICTAG